MGLHYPSRHDSKPPKHNFPEMADWTSVAQQTFNFQCEITTLTCQLCDLSTNMTERLFEDSGTTSKPLFSQCLRFFCSDCTQLPRGRSRPISCGHSPPHAMAAVSLNGAILEEDSMPTPPAVVGELALAGLPSKATALLRQLNSQAPDVKRSVS